MNNDIEESGRENQECFNDVLWMLTSGVEAKNHVGLLEKPGLEK